MSNPSQKPSAAAAGEQWDEAKLRELRSTVPKMHERLSASNNAEAARAAMNEVNNYKKLVTSPENTKILERAKQSRKDNPKGIKPWRPRDDPNWLNPDKPDEPDEADTSGMSD